MKSCMLHNRPEMDGKEKDVKTFSLTRVKP